MNPSTSPPPGSGSGSGTPYQHWLDDAANMGLMLFRMRNDSKRERIVAGNQSQPPQRAPHHHHQQQQHPHQPVRRPPPPPATAAPSPVYADATPRTNRALQTPTVATDRSGVSTNSSSGTSFYVPLD